MIDVQLSAMLRCPICGRTPLELRIENGTARSVHTGGLHCNEGGHRFPIRNGIPALLPRGLTPDLGIETTQWLYWHRKLANFVAWRSVTHGSEPLARPKSGNDAYAEFQRSFFEFSGLQSSTTVGHLLDVGSAAGGIRAYLSPAWKYCGLDPLPILPMYDFWMVQAVGEYMPFRDQSFEVVLVMQTLDHCADASQLLNEARRVLRSGGRVMIQQVVNRNRRSSLRRTLWRAGRRLLRPNKPDPTDTKVADFTSESLRRLVSRYFPTLDMQVLGGHQAFIVAKAAELG